VPYAQCVYCIVNTRPRLFQWIYLITGSKYTLQLCTAISQGTEKQVRWVMKCNSFKEEHKENVTKLWIPKDLEWRQIPIKRVIYVPFFCYTNMDGFTNFDYNYGVKDGCQPGLKL